MARYTFATWAAPFYNAVYILLVLSLINLGLRRYAPRLSFNKLELLAIYAMVSIGSALISSDMQGILVTLMGYPTYFADDMNQFNQLFHGTLPSWLMVTSKDALAGFYKGNSTFFTPQHILAWIKPIIPWTLFIWALMLMMMCVSTILRKAWVERERLTFPIVALPMAMAEEPESFFKNKLMWLGFAIAGIITLINGLSFLYPNVPYIPIKRQDIPILTGGPMDAIGRIRIAFYFFGITLGFLMPQDLSFSIYFFKWLNMAEAVLVRMSGASTESGFPYYDSQAFGAYLAIFCVAGWGLKSHIKNVWRIAMGRGEPNEDADEPMSYRSAIIWLGISSLFLLAFSVAAGMKPIVAVIFFAIYLGLAVMISRIRAEFGFPVHDMHFMGPAQTLTRVFGPQAFDRQTLGVFSMFYWFNRVYRSHPMPHIMEGMKMAGTDDGSSQRSMFRAMLIGGMVAVPICFLVYLQNFYARGAASGAVNVWGTGYGSEMFNSTLPGWLNPLSTVDHSQVFATLTGFGIAIALAALRMSIVGFPFHPLAYAVSNSWGVDNLWLPIMIGSICKFAVLRSGGLKGYRKAVFFFFGLMLGELAVGCSGTLFGMLFHIRTYDFWP